MAKKRKPGRPRKKREYNKTDTVKADDVTPCRCGSTDFTVLRTVAQSLGNGAEVVWRYRKCVVCGQRQRQAVAS